MFLINLRPTSGQIYLRGHLVSNGDPLQSNLGLGYVCLGDVSGRPPFLQALP